MIAIDAAARKTVNPQVAAAAERVRRLEMVAHDLRNMIAMISLNSVMISDLAPGGEAGNAIRNYAEINTRYVARMNQVISDLLSTASGDV